MEYSVVEVKQVKLSQVMQYRVVSGGIV